MDLGISDYSKLVIGKIGNAVQATAVLGVLAIEFSHESMFLRDAD